MASGVLPEQVTDFSHFVPFAVYPLLHETAVHVPVDEHAVQVPLLTLIEEQAVHELAPADDHVPVGHAAHELPFTYCPAAQFSRAQPDPFHAYPAEHVAEVHADPSAAHAVHVPFDTEIEEHGLQQPFASQELPPTV